VKKLLAISLVLVLTLSLAACNKKIGEKPAAASPASSKAGILPPITAAFLSAEEGREALKPLVFGSISWVIYGRGNYLFAHYYSNYIVRYNIAANQIDKIVYLDKGPEYFYYSPTFSPDGNFCVAQAREFDGPGETGRIFIDFEQETAIPTQQEQYLHSDNRSEGVTILGDAYHLYPGEFILLDENRMGAILRSADETKSGMLGYYRFVIIDIKKDKILQECRMN